jgi:hypothetical protein
MIAVGRQEVRSKRLVKYLSIPLRLCVFARVKKKKELVFPQCYGTGSLNATGQAAK